jgi:uncharacterized membrane protein
MEKPKNVANAIMLKTAAWTLVVLFVSFSYGFMLAGLMFPANMARFSESMGANSSAAMFRERAYNRNSSPMNAYRALSANAVAGRHDVVVRMGNKFFDVDGKYSGEGVYGKLMDDIKWQFKKDKPTASAIQYVLYMNPDDRIKFMYISSLLSKGDIDRAVNFYLSDAVIGGEQQNRATVDLNRPQHAFFAFVAHGQHERVDVETATNTYFNEIRAALNTRGSHLNSIEGRGELALTLDFLLQFSMFGYLSNDGLFNISEADMDALDIQFRALPRIALHSSAGIS